MSRGRGDFFGRKAELSEVARLLARGERRITLHGPPGVGKTRLLREIARWSGAATIHEVSLDGAATREDVLAAITRAFGLAARSRDVRRTIDRLRLRFDAEPALVLFDEVESVTRELAEITADLVDATDGATFLIASRKRLGGELVLPIRGLAEPDAAAMLVERMARVGASRPDDGAVLCAVRALDALPLAIELAAARARITGLTEAVSAEPLDPADLKRLLQRSWSALSLSGRRVLAEASVFRCSFDLASAHAVLVPDETVGVRAALLEALADASLIELLPGPRFKLLSVVRAFAAERLEEMGGALDARRRHAEHLADRMADAQHAGLDSPAIWARLTLEREDLLAAFDALSSEDPPRAGELARGLDALLVTQGPPSLHRRVLATALTGAPAEVAPRARVELLRARGRASGLAGRHREAVDDYREAMALAMRVGDPRLVGWTSAFLAFSLRAVGEVEEARDRAFAALAVARELGDLRLEAMGEQTLGVVALAAGDAEVSAVHERRAAAAARMAVAPRLEGIAEANLSTALVALGDLDGASEAITRARACFERIGDGFHLAKVMVDEAVLMRRRGELERAEAHLVGALARIQEQDDLAGEVAARGELAAVAHAFDDGDLARRRIEDALALARRIDDRQLQARVEALARDLLDTRSDAFVRGAGPSRERSLVVATDGRAFVVSGIAVDLSRRAALRRILVALADARRDRPGEALDVAAVRGAGWPGERMNYESGVARVYMAIRRLRALGLERVLLTRDDGYLLDPGVPLRVDADVRNG